jgi:hypothetical protein
MRTTLLVVAILAGMGLAACSGGGSALPGGSQAASGNSQSRGHADAFRMKFMTAGVSCPSTWKVCYNISYGTPINYSVCMAGGSGKCTTAGWNWSQVLFTLKNHVKSFRILSSFSTNPGNPVTVTANERFPINASRIGVKYTSEIIACEPNSPSNCVAQPVGLIPQ